VLDGWSLLIRDFEFTLLRQLIGVWQKLSQELLREGHLAGFLKMIIGIVLHLFHNVGEILKHLQSIRLGSLRHTERMPLALAPHLLFMMCQFALFTQNIRIDRSASLLSSGMILSLRNSLRYVSWFRQ
jgi:hypothetical protein